MPVVVFALPLETLTLLANPLRVLLLEPPLRRSTVALELDGLIVEPAVLGVEIALILRETLLLLRDSTPLLLFRESPLLVAALLLLLFGVLASFLVAELVVALPQLAEILVMLAARRILSLRICLLLFDLDLVLLLGLTALYVILLRGLMRAEPLLVFALLFRLPLLLLFA